jgi:lysozyme
MVYKTMRSFIFEKNSEIKYYVPLVRSFDIAANGFSSEDINKIREIVSGNPSKDSHSYSTEITFDRDKLISLMDSGDKSINPAIDSIEIRTDIDEDPVTTEIANALSVRINNQISLSKKIQSRGEDERVHKKSEPSDTTGLSISENGINIIKKFEGFRSTPYVCPGGVLTIGYGVSMKPGEYRSVSEQQADALLRKKVISYENHVKKLVKVPLSQNQYDALVSLTYNIGGGALAKSSLIKKLNDEDYNGAAEEFLKWNKSKGEILKGLVRRREEERKLFLT